MFQISPNSKEHSDANEKIHSGQFMISKYDAESDSEDLVNYDENLKGYSFNAGCLKKNFQFVQKGPFEPKLEIEDSLNTMFQFLNIAMSGKITNPKWNPFKGVQFQPKDKIRLNNIIWREYHMQFVKKLKPVVVQFASPLSDTLQINGNVVLEGKYWKRTFSIIVHQYKKWRMFYKHRVVDNFEDAKSAALFDSILVQRNLYQKIYTNSPLPNLNEIFMDLDDFNLPIDDISGVQHNSQIMQPQLTNLQPRMESSIDFLNDYFCAPQKTIKSQKPFSSETCLNIKPTEQRMPPPGSDHVLGSCKVVKRKLDNRDLPICEYQRRPPIADGRDLGPDVGFCRTPNLLSILLQPIVSEQRQNVRSRQTYAASENDQSISLGSMGDVDAFWSVSRPSDGVLKTSDYGGGVTGYFPDRPRASRHPPPLKHSLTANNIVQQYLDELSGLLLSTRDQNKVSKAALLHKAAEHIRRMRVEKHRLQAEVVKMQTEIDALQSKFSAFCSQLPANGVCLNDNKSSEGKKWFEDFVAKRSFANWKFYIFSMMFESLFTGYNGSVSCASTETLVHSVASWLEKECSLMKLRLVVMNGVRTLSRRTSIVHSPSLLEEEVVRLMEAGRQGPDQGPQPSRYAGAHWQQGPSVGCLDRQQVG